MLLGMACIFSEGGFIDRLAEYDCERRKERLLAEGKGQLSISIPSDERLREESRRWNLQGIRVLRDSLLGSLLVVTTALALAFLCVWLLSRHAPIDATNLRLYLSIGSMVTFVVATLGRVGWPRKSYEEGTTLARVDDLIYRGLYGLGTFLGALALLPYR